MQQVSVGFAIEPKIIAAEYEVISSKRFKKIGLKLDFTIEEYSEYLNLVLNSVISKSGGIATQPFRFIEAPVSNSLNIAFQGIGLYVDSLRDTSFVPVSQVKTFTISEAKFLAIRSALQTVSTELAIVNKVPGPRSSDLKDVMSSRVVGNIIYSINDTISPSSVVSCSLVQPQPDKIVAFAEQQNTIVETLAYLDKLARI